MTEFEERKVLKQLLATLGETAPTKWAWQAMAIDAVSFCVLIVIVLWLFQNSSLMDAPHIVALLGAVFSGAMIGAVNTWKLLCKNSALVCRFIDSDRVRARLAELEP